RAGTAGARLGHHHTAVHPGHRGFPARDPCGCAPQGRARGLDLSGVTPTWRPGPVARAVAGAHQLSPPVRADPATARRRSGAPPRPTTTPTTGHRRELDLPSAAG